MLRRLLPRVEKPGRYLGCEVNAVFKDPAKVELRVALAFPDVYEIAFSHVGLKILYEILNAQPEVWAERVYAPWFDLEAELRAAQLPLFALESKDPLHTFDLIGFSLQHELAASNIPMMLELGAIPIRQSARGENDPLVIAGGPNAANPEPLAAFFDAFVLGEGEEVIVEIATALRQAKKDGLSRQQKLLALARIEGVYVPSFYTPGPDGVLRPTEPQVPARPKRRVVADLDTTAFFSNPLLPTVEPVHDRYAVEIQRGCTRGCRFCQAGFLFRPVRQRSPETILRLAREGLTASGQETLGLLSLSASDYAPLLPVTRALFAEHGNARVSLQLPSLRVETLGTELAEQLNQERKTGFTLAPEAATERLRRVINKGNTEDDLMSGLEAAFKNGWRHVKLYFMIGLPSETEEDVAAIVELGQRVKALARQFDRAIDVTISASTFVPKPFTPFQWATQIGSADIRDKQSLLRAGLGRAKLTYRWHDWHASLLESALARGGRELSAVIEHAYQAGCRFDSWTDKLDWERWQAAFASAGLDLESYATRPFALDAALPWAHLDFRVDEAYLREEWRRAFAGEARGDCAYDRCEVCGVCADDAPARAVYGLQNESQDAPHARAVEMPAPVKPRSEGIVGALRQVRFQYAKREWAVFFGHLDTMSQIARAFRRAQVRLKYSEGFHPKPRLAFSQALPLGVSSTAEFFDAQLFDPAPLPALIERLNQALPRGLRILDARVVAGTVASLSEGIGANVYQFDLRPRLTPEVIAERLAVVAREGLPSFTRDGKSGPRLMETGLYLENLACPEPGLVAADFVVRQGVALKPSEFLAQLFGLPPGEQSAITIEKTGVRFASRPPLTAPAPNTHSQNRRFKEHRNGSKVNHQRNSAGDARRPPGKRGDG